MAGNAVSGDASASDAPAEKAPHAHAWDIPDFLRMQGGEDSGESSVSNSSASSPHESGDEAAAEDDMDVDRANAGIGGVNLRGRAKDPSRGVRFMDCGDGAGGGRLDALEAAAQRRAQGSWKPSAKQVDFGADGGGDAGEGGSDEEDTTGLTGNVGADEEGLYDPDMDDLDQQFVDNRRRRHLPGHRAAARAAPPKPKKTQRDPGESEAGEAGGAEAGAGGGWTAHVAPSGHEYYFNSTSGESTWVKPDGFEGDGRAMRPPTLRSDAVLSCPGCFSIVCLDCQRHAKHEHQYRAMFAQNCEVVRTETLEVDGDTFHPVRCAHCRADIAVLDTDEVFHFFDVIPSNG
jgi:hypothetical protein